MGSANHARLAIEADEAGDASTAIAHYKTAAAALLGIAERMAAAAVVGAQQQCLEQQELVLGARDQWTVGNTSSRQGDPRQAQQT